MASSCIVPVIEVRNIREHPGADTLSIVEVLGYQIISNFLEDPNGPIVREFVAGERDAKGYRIPAKDRPDAPKEQVRFRHRYKDGDRAVYFAADTILPDKWVDEFEIRPYVKTGNRIGRARIRGEPSFGMISAIPDGQNWELGQNVADYYGATKWSPPADKIGSPDGARHYDSDLDPMFEHYTDIENGWLLYQKFMPDEEVVATEKIHGKNVRVGLVNGVLCAGSMTERKDPDKKTGSAFWAIAEDVQVNSLIRFVRREKEAKVVIVYGEVFGHGVQSLHYGTKKQKGFRAFDIYVDGKFLDYESFLSYCKTNGVETAPEIFRGTFDLAKIKAISNGPSVMPGADHIREGVVVRPVKERRDPALGRVVLKFVSNEFDLSKHKDKDTTDL